MQSCDPFTQTIFMDHGFWHYTANETLKELVLLHELGHCDLNRGHYNREDKDDEDRPDPTIDGDNFSLMTRRMFMLLNDLFFSNDDNFFLSRLNLSAEMEDIIGEAIQESLREVYPNRDEVSGYLGEAQEQLLQELQEAYVNVFDGDLNRLLDYMIQELFSEENTDYKNTIVIMKSCTYSDKGPECSEFVRSQNAYFQLIVRPYPNSISDISFLQHVTIGPSLGMSYEEALQLR